jgi:hypothetical protein
MYKIMYTGLDFYISLRDCVENLGMRIDCKHHFHHIEFPFSHIMKLLGLIRTIMFSFFSKDSLMMLYLLRSNLNLNMLLLLRTLLRLLTPINLSA